jgi:hypothetical protein
MKIKIEIDFDRREQEEISVEAKLDNSQVRKIVLNFFYNMDYDQRRSWVEKNIKKEHIKEIRSIV